jgi:hypothetical protein
MKSLINIENDGLFIETQKETPKKDKSMKNIVKSSNILSKNEIRISKIVKKIPRFFLYFEPISGSRDFKLAEIDDERFEKCKIMNESTEYFLFQYENREKSCDFFRFFSNNASKKIKIIKMINSFKNLLNITKLLDEKKIVHMNIVPKNIFFTKDECPYLTNFDQSFILEKDELERKSNEEVHKYNFSEYNPYKIHLPLEAHLLCYMNDRKCDSLSAANIETVVNDWVGGVSLSPFGKYISEEFKAAAIFSRNSLINKPKNVIMNELLSFAGTWNNYSINIIYLYLLSSLDEQEYSHKFIDSFVCILLLNISGDCSKRETVGKTLEVFDDLIYSISQEEWSKLFS